MTRRKLRIANHGKIDDIDFEVGSGNVFADLDLDNPDERLAKAKLAAEINAIIEQTGGLNPMPPFGSRHIPLFQLCDTAG
jgi:hypothetical protein